MARVTVRHSCGHAEQVQMPGSSNQYPEGAVLNERRRCSRCQSSTRGSRAAERAQQRGLPSLTGTESQIQWALSVRNEKFSAVEAFIRDTSKRIPQGQREWLERQLSALMALLMAQTEAGWWIARRSRNARELLKEMDRSEDSPPGSRNSTRGITARR